MGNYSNGENTNRAIINAGKKLFYDKGYRATRINDIALEAGVNPGLIHYYFKTKGNIALAIYTEILENQMKVMDSLFPNESVQIINAIELRIYWYFITHGEAYKRFLYEISLERIPHELTKGIGVDYFVALNEEYPFEQDKEMLKMLCLCSFAIETEMIVGYTECYFSFPEERLAEFDIKSMFELMSVPHDRIELILNRSKELFSQLSIKLLPEFVVDVSLKK
jgi:AcrR family transcriptional regulator